VKKILLLGSGYVAAPAADYVLRREENHLTVASSTLKNAQALAQGRHNTTAVQFDIRTDEHKLEALVAEHDLVISLIPWIYHAIVLKAAIKHKKNVVTTSYVNPKMAELDEAAKEAGVTILNEVGLDPGIDHFYALKMIDSVHAQGGKILSFLSYCGGLPAPECSNNPLGYKFSWSPRGVLLALRQEARFRENGQTVIVAGPDLLKSAKPIFTYPAFAVLGYPNRDSTPYDKKYSIPEAHTILRGTLRYQGNPQFMQALVDLGMLDDTHRDYLAPDASPITWRQLMAKHFGTADDQVGTLRAEAAKRSNLKGEEKDRILNGMSWFGFFSDKPAPQLNTILDAVAKTLEQYLSYKPGERDMVLLQHKFEIELADGRKELRTSTMLEYGEPWPGVTAMAKTVGVPCGIAVQLILDGKLAQKGVLAPFTPAIYEPIIEQLEKDGIRCIEETVATY